MKKLIVLLTLLFLMSDYLFAQSNIYLKGDFATVYKKAKSAKKKLLVLLDFQDNGNTPSVLIMNQLISKKLPEKFKTNYIFYKCNIKNGVNDYIYQMLVIKAFPAVCIFDESGTLRYYCDGKCDVKGFEKVISNLSQESAFHGGTPAFRTKDEKKLLEMLDHTIKANLNYLSGQSGLSDINKSILIEKNFYNLYLKYKILMKSGETSLAQKTKKEALDHVRGGYQFEVQKALIYDINGKKMK